MRDFFFFKQKTAYEMRISDWSSDVCSSDLSCTSAISRIRTCAPLGMVATTKLRSSSTDLYLPASRTRISWFWVFTLPVGKSRLEEIGRASCRERVCQYV